MPLLIVQLEAGCFPLGALWSGSQPGWPGDCSNYRALARSQREALQVGVSAAPGDPPTRDFSFRHLLLPQATQHQNRDWQLGHPVGMLTPESLNICAPDRITKL